MKGGDSMKRQEVENDVDDLIVNYLQYISDERKMRLLDFMKGIVFCEGTTKLKDFFFQ